MASPFKYEDQNAIDNLLCAAEELLGNTISTGAYGPDDPEEFEDSWFDDDGDAWWPDIARLANAIDVMRGESPRCHEPEDE